MFFENFVLATIDVDSWDTIKVVNMIDMFRSCTILDADVSGFNIVALTNATNMFLGSAFARVNYNALLIAWEGQAHNTGVTLHAGSAVYDGGAPTTARADLVTDSWVITDGGQNTNVVVDGLEILVDGNPVELV